MNKDQGGKKKENGKKLIKQHCRRQKKKIKYRENTINRRPYANDFGFRMNTRRLGASTTKTLIIPTRKRLTDAHITIYY